MAGVKKVMAGVTVKRVVVTKGPFPGVVTVMGPVVAPAGTVVVIVPELLTVNVAATPLNETDVAPAKVVPVIVTAVPTGPKIGVNGLKLIPSRKATMSSAVVGPIVEVLIGPEVSKWFPSGKIVFPRAAILGQMALVRNDFISGEKLEPIYLRETKFVKAPPPRIIG